MAVMLLSLPPEVILHIFSYLDVPDLEQVAKASPELQCLSQDPVLHHARVYIVGPSRVQHSLFALGGSLRPSFGDLVHWGVMRGLGLERRWRTGLYCYSPLSAKLYETSLHLERTHVRNVLSTYIQDTRSEVDKTALALQALHLSRILPDVESSSPAISRSLLPTVRRLKWSIQKDSLAKMVRHREGSAGTLGASISWFEGRGRGLLEESERVRLAICPGVRRMVRFYENLGASG